MSHMQQMLIGSSVLVLPPPLHSGTFNTVGFADTGTQYYGFSVAYPSHGSYTNNSGYNCRYFTYNTGLASTIVEFFENISGGSPIIVTLNGTPQTFTWNSTYALYIKAGDPFNLIGSYPSSPNWLVSVET